MSELNDIFGSDKGRLSDEELLKYLDEKTSELEKHDLEKKLEDSEFEKEALEGLEQFSSKNTLDKYVKQINSNLHQNLDKKKKKKSKKINELPLAVVAIILILVLCVLAYLVVHFLQRT